LQQGFFHFRKGSFCPFKVCLSQLQRDIFYLFERGIFTLTKVVFSPLQKDFFTFAFFN
jgi:hypothetical protein